MKNDKELTLMPLIALILNCTLDGTKHDPLHSLAVSVNGPQSLLQVSDSPVSHILLPQQLAVIVLMH